VQIALRCSSDVGTAADDLQITLRNHARGSGDTSLVSLVASLELPSAAGAVQVTSPDIDVAPRIELNFLDTVEDRNVLREAVERAIAIAQAKPLSAYLGRPGFGLMPGSRALDRWLRAAVRTSQHGVGTCRMGPASDDTAVVDQVGRIHGIDNLRVIDASVFPQIVRANTNATAIMVGERMAEFVSSGA
jgi:choline dehydrogenase